MKKATRKGFTIVELLVVIAVIAVLAAVLIPVMVYLIDDAKTSADEQTVASLNKLIASETGDFETASDAVEAANDVGYNLETLDLDSDNELVWDQGTGYFALIDEDGEEVYSNGTLSDSQYLWKIVGSDEEVTTATASAGEDGTVTYAAKTIVASAATDTVYSYYLKEGYEPEITFSAGVDAGRNEGLDLNVEAAYSGILVNGNGGTVTISGSGSATFYGEADYLKVSAATVTTAASSSVDTIYASDSAKVTVNGSYEAVASNGATISGVDEDEIVTMSSEPSSDFAGGLGTSGSPYKIATAEQFEAIGNLSSDMISTAYYFRLTADIDLVETMDSAAADTPVSKYFQGELDGDGYSVTLGKSSENKNDDSRYLFMHNTGDATFKNIILKESTYVGGILEYVNQLSGYDGDVTFEDITVKNADGLSLTQGYSSYFGPICMSVCGSDEKTVSFVRVNNEAKISLSGYGGFLIANFYFVSSSDLDSDGAPAIKSYIVYDSCYNYGTISGVNVGFLTGNKCGGDACNADDITILATDENFSNAGYGINVCVSGCGNNGTLRGTTSAGAFCTFGDSGVAALNTEIEESGSFVDTGSIVVSSYDVSLELDGEGNVVYSDSISGQSYYTITVKARIHFAGDTDEDGTVTHAGTGYVTLTEATDSGVQYISEIISATEYAEEYGTKITSFDKESAEGWVYTLVEADGEYIAVVDTDSVPSTFETTNAYFREDDILTYTLNVYDSGATVIASFSTSSL